MTRTQTVVIHQGLTWITLRISWPAFRFPRSMRTTVSATLGLVTYRLVSERDLYTREDNSQIPHRASVADGSHTSHDSSLLGRPSTSPLRNSKHRRPARVKAESVSRERIPPWDPHSHPLRPVPGSPRIVTLSTNSTQSTPTCHLALLRTRPAEVNTPRCACRPTSPSYLCRHFRLPARRRRRRIESGRPREARLGGV